METTLLMSLLSLGIVYGSKILIIAPDHHSYTNMFAVAGGALVEAGHEVHCLTVARHKKLVDRHGMKGIYFEPKYYTNPWKNPAHIVLEIPHDFKSHIKNLYESIAGLCHEMLEDKELNSQIQKAKYDIAVVDSLHTFRCLMVIPYRHGIPYISLGMQHAPWAARVAASPSAEGLYELHPLADPSNPTLWERWRDVVMEAVVYISTPPPQMTDDFITKYAPDRPAITMTELYQDSELHFMKMEICCLETPRVSAPHYVFLGGIGTEPAKPLRGSFKEFVNDAKDGLIVVSFGSLIGNLPMSRMQVMMTAFKQIPESIVMRYDGPRPAEVPTNIKLSAWLPQNDLLGHPKTRLFITHAGANGQTSLSYHGVPFVSIPVAFDQKYNAERAVVRGFGTMLDFLSFSSDDLVSAIRQVVDDPLYRDRIQNCSATFRALPNPQKTFTFWVEHVIKHGGDHLKPTTLKMSLWRWFNLDILAICLVIVHLMLWLVKYTFKAIWFGFVEI